MNGSYTLHPTQQLAVHITRLIREQGMPLPALVFVSGMLPLDVRSAWVCYWGVCVDVDGWACLHAWLVVGVFMCIHPSE